MPLAKITVHEAIHALVVRHPRRIGAGRTDCRRRPRRRVQRAHQRADFRQPSGAQDRPRLHLRPRLADRRVPGQPQPLPDRRSSGGVWLTTTTAPPGLRFSTTTAPTPSATSPSIRRIPPSSGWAPARTTISAASPTATASTRARTADAPSATSASSSPSTSRASWWTRAIPTWSTSPRPARCGRAAASAASTRPPTAARPGRRA